MNKLKARMEHYDTLIPRMYETFPEGFALTPKDWAVDNPLGRGMITRTVKGKELTMRRIGTMDVEFLSNATVRAAKEKKVNLAKDYPCGLQCPGCFSEEGIYGQSEYLMYWQQVMEQIDVARRIGLRSIKFLGPGELFQNPDLFSILDACEERNLPISIFTKGTELGDDQLARYNYGHEGINSAKQLVDRIAEYDCVRILLGFNSVYPERQDALVGSKANSTNYHYQGGIFVNRGVANYTKKRDVALQNLVEAGFTNPAKGQRLSLIMTPMMRNQADEAVEIYEWGARRNIPVIISPTMESGEKAQKLVTINSIADRQNNWVTHVLVAIYSRAIDTGIATIDQIKSEGLSAYFGTKGCNQVSNGLYMRLNGQVKMCPGTSTRQYIYGNVSMTPLEQIWMASANHELGARDNDWCPAKVTSLTDTVREDALAELIQKYS